MTENMVYFCRINLNCGLQWYIRPTFLNRTRKIICVKHSGIFPNLASWNVFSGTPMEAPLDGSMTSAYRG
jgi:hypothetical protein